MPKYRFLVHDGVHQPTPDVEDLPGLDEARSKAVIYAGDLLRDADGAFWEHGANWRVDVTDETGLILYSLLVIGVAAPAVPSI